MYEYVCGECETILSPPEIMPHRKTHDMAAVTVTRRDVYEDKHGQIAGEN